MTSPNFFLLGGKRCGTSSLYRRLDAHPEIAFPYKEIHYFSYKGEGTLAGRSNVVTTPDEYYRLYEPLADIPVRGDASPSYLTTEAAAGRLAREVPDATLVAVLRHPVDRMYSDYLHERQAGREPAATFEEALEADGGEGRQNYAHKSDYAQHIERFQALFPADRLRFLVYEDYVADPTGFVQGIYDLVGVDATFVPPRPDEWRRPSGIPKSRRLARALGARPVRSVARAVLPSGLHARLGNRLYTANTERPSMDAETRARQLQRVADDIQRVEQLLERDLNEWRT